MGAASLVYDAGPGIADIGRGRVEYSAGQSVGAAAACAIAEVHARAYGVGAAVLSEKALSVRLVANAHGSKQGVARIELQSALADVADDGIRRGGRGQGQEAFAVSAQRDVVGKWGIGRARHY